MITKVSGVSRLRRGRLRVLPGGLHMPAETTDRRLAEGDIAGAQMRSAVSLLALAMALNVAAVLALYWQLEPSARLTCLLPGVGAVVLALGMGLVTRARQHLCHLLPPSRLPAQRTHWSTNRSHAR